ncbi:MULTISPECIES: L-histidine N(alpha)-methyltransferase [Aphanothece]|uniref:L-histidine N(alpha)-methyltransferase n=1 Tax=Aphanothece TaxID=1121 RepID=UPI0039848FF3
MRTCPLIDLHPETADMAALVTDGMEQRPRQLPAWLLYDAQGSRLFEAICAQPEYTLTRVETALLEQRAPELAASLGKGVLVEFGAGSARKVAPLLRALQPPAYVPLDISADHLAAACAELQAEHPSVPVLGICCDYSRLQRLPDHPLLAGQRLLGFYPGSSLGNFTPAEARRLLGQFARLLGPGSRLLIGIDQPKPAARLEAAYDDAAGVSAAFARNLLVRLNRDLDGDFDPSAFEYQARWEAEHSRIAMALISRRRQRVRLAGRSWTFEPGEQLITEYSLKYTPEAFTALAAAAGWRPRCRWSDPAGDLSLHLLEQDGVVQDGRVREG